MSVERFEPSGGGGQGAAYYEMDKASDGEWVRFEDYEKLHKELDTLSARFTALIQQNNTLAAENERLSEKLAAMQSQNKGEYEYSNEYRDGVIRGYHLGQYGDDVMLAHILMHASDENLPEPLPVPADNPGHWAVMNPGRADQYRAESVAVRKELGFSSDSDEVAPIDLLSAIRQIRADKPRITEQDAREILIDFHKTFGRLYSTLYCDSWLETDEAKALLDKLNADREQVSAVAVPDSIIEDLRQAVMVVAYRSADIDTEDGSYATTDTDCIIRLESALCEALGTRYDDIDLDEAINLLENLSSESVSQGLMAASYARDALFYKAELDKVLAAAPSHSQHSSEPSHDSEQGGEV